MADKMEVDAVVGEKQVEASGPAPAKPTERSTFANSILYRCEQLLTTSYSHNRQLRSPRPSRRDIRLSLHPSRPAIHLHHPKGRQLSNSDPHSPPHSLSQRKQPSTESPGGPLATEC